MHTLKHNLYKQLYEPSFCIKLFGMGVSVQRHFSVKIKNVKIQKQMYSERNTNRIVCTSSFKGHSRSMWFLILYGKKELHEIQIKNKRGADVIKKILKCIHLAHTGPQLLFIAGGWRRKFAV